MRHLRHYPSITAGQVVCVIICTMCRSRLSYDDGTHAHPHCRGAAPLTDPEMGRLVAALGDLLGARPLTTQQESQ